jgi:hypothetical protein
MAIDILKIKQKSRDYKGSARLSLVLLKYWTLYLRMF